MEEAQLVLQQLNGQTVQGCIIGVAPDEEGAAMAAENRNANVAPTPAEAAAGAVSEPGADVTGGFQAGFEGAFDYNAEGEYLPISLASICLA